MTSPAAAPRPSSKPSATPAWPKPPSTLPRPTANSSSSAPPRAPVTADLNDFLQPVHKSWVTIKGALEHRVPVNPARGNPLSIAGNARTILNLVSSGRLRLDELISHRLPADEIAAAYHGLLNQPNEYWGVALDWR